VNTNYKELAEKKSTIDSTFEAYSKNMLKAPSFVTYPPF